jgi:Flp pilus assembly protein protease CpaA
MDGLEGCLHWYFSRLAGQIWSPGSDIGHLPIPNITSLSIFLIQIHLMVVYGLSSIYGLMHFNRNSNENNNWYVFNSERHIPNRLSMVNISSLTVLNRIKNASIEYYTITNRSLSVIYFAMWILV